MNDDLSKQGSPTRLLVVLLSKGRVTRSSVSKKYGMDYRAAVAAFEYLEKLGLVLYEALGDRRDTVYWSLTEKGEKAARMLAELDEFIRNG